MDVYIAGSPTLGILLWTNPDIMRLGLPFARHGATSGMGLWLSPSSHCLAGVPGSMNLQSPLHRSTPLRKCKERVKMPCYPKVAFSIARVVSRLFKSKNRKVMIEFTIRGFNECKLKYNAHRDLLWVLQESWVFWGSINSYLTTCPQTVAEGFRNLVLHMLQSYELR